MPPRRQSAAPLKASTTAVTPSGSASHPRRSSRHTTSATATTDRGNDALRPRRSVITTTAPLSRPARDRKPRTNYSPSAAADAPKRPYHRRHDHAAPGVADSDLTPDERCRRLEGRVRSHVKQLRYLQTFLEAYEAEGWRRASREKLKPSQELAVARRKIVKAKRRVVDALHEMDALRLKDPPIPFLIELQSELPQPQPRENERDGLDLDAHIYCSRCLSTVTTDDNDILLCDGEGCFRAFHQQCQVPSVATDAIPQGDEPWFCASCLAIFNALKAINYTCDTTHEKIGDVFPELVHDEESLLAEGDYDVSTAEGTAEEDDTAEDADDDDEEDDEDFVMDDDVPDGSDDRTDEASDSGAESGDTSGDDGVLVSDVSDDELQHLHDDDVIDTNRRSMRSHADPHAPAIKSFVGQRVAKQTDDGEVVFGVVVEKDSGSQSTASPWRVVYFDDTMEHLDDQAVSRAIDMAAAHAAQGQAREGEEVDRSLILRGKRKRSRVDYRALNDLMFAGQEDSDAGDDDHVESESEDDDDANQPPASETNATTAADSSTRSRRARRHVDYRAMHEGLSD